MPARKEPDSTTYAGRFAVRLRTLREKKKMTIEEAADALGISTPTLYTWESAMKFPHLTDFPAIAEVYELRKIKDLLPNE